MSLNIAHKMTSIILQPMNAGLRDVAIATVAFLRNQARSKESIIGQERHMEISILYTQFVMDSLVGGRRDVTFVARDVINHVVYLVRYEGPLVVDSLWDDDIVFV